MENEINRKANHPAKLDSCEGGDEPVEPVALDGLFAHLRDSCCPLCHTALTPSA
jgi:hypothetical protein